LGPYAGQCSDVRRVADESAVLETGP
jgi:hypothetical protein